MDELKDVNCITTWEGMYRFTYEVDVGGGICDSPDNVLTACQDPGSSYVDNRVFSMNFARCPGIQTSFQERKNTLFSCTTKIKSLHNLYSNLAYILSHSVLLPRLSLAILYLL